ncbi:uncharacterized protein LOC144095060 isoform X2 [Amblyomma americanum]
MKQSAIRYHNIHHGNVCASRRSGHQGYERACIEHVVTASESLVHNADPSRPITLAVGLRFQQSNGGCGATSLRQRCVG